MSFRKFLAAHIAYALHRPATRSPEWKRVRAAHLREFPKCAACGLTDHAEVHHLMPFHLDPALELDPANLITLCLAQGRLCHLTIGHGGSFRTYNPDVVTDAREMYVARRCVDSATIKAVTERAKKFRKEGVPT